LREFGVAIAGAAAGCVVALSWWGVNLLGVGLHSYGFTSGIQSALSSYYAIQGSIVLLGLAALWRERRAKRAGLSAQSPTVADHEKPPGARRAA
jgi:hypothetical protein